INRFVELAGGEKAELVVAILGTANTDDLLDTLRARKTAGLVVLPLKERVDGGTLAAVQTLRKATGVWLVASDPPDRVIRLVRDMAVAQELRDVRLRGGVVAASASATQLLGRRFAYGLGLKPDGPAAGGLGSV